MGKDTAIEWADHTFNPWTGCTKVSEACRNCYAEAMAKRFPHLGGWGPGAERKRTSATNWRKPLGWDREAALGADHYDGGTGDMTGWQPPRVFCASLADWLDQEVPAEWLADLLALIAATPNLDWLLLTKRPELWRERIESAVSVRPPGGWSAPRDVALATGVNMGAKWLEHEPPPNVWVGCTVEDQRNADKRIPHLFEIPARVRFLSCEPLLGPVDLRQWDGLPSAMSWPAPGVEPNIHRNPRIDWVICGGESGPGARPMHPDWARSLRDQCQFARVAFHFKQWGAWAPIAPVYADDPDDGDHVDTIQARSEELGGAVEVALCPAGYVAQGWDNRTGKGWCHHQPDDGSWWLSRVGKKAAGRELDGRTWDEVPRCGAA